MNDKLSSEKIYSWKGGKGTYRDKRLEVVVGQSDLLLRPDLPKFYPSEIRQHKLIPFLTAKKMKKNDRKVQ